MSDSDEKFDLLRGIKPNNFESLAINVTYSINREEIATASAYVDPEQLLSTTRVKLVCTFLNPIFEFSGAPSIGVGQSHSQGRMQYFSGDDD